MSKSPPKILILFLLLSFFQGSTVIRSGQDRPKISGSAAGLIAGGFWAERHPGQNRRMQNETGTGELLQCTAGGHVLGFRKGGMFVASGDHALRVEFVNARPISPEEEAISQAPESSSHAAQPLAKVSYRDLWDGVTLVYEKHDSGVVKSVYYVEPAGTGAVSPVDEIRLRYNVPVKVDDSGGLILFFATGEMRESRPVAGQEIEGNRVPAEVTYRLRGQQEVGFKAESYDPRYPLVIDPVLSWNTFLGGSNYDIGYGIAVDASGNVYVAGQSDATWGSPVLPYTGSANAFVAKLDGSGVLQWNTFLGGYYEHVLFGIAVDTNGNVYVTGYSWHYGYAVKFNNIGVLQWSTLLGGVYGVGYGIAVDTNGNVYVTGYSDMPWGSPLRPYTEGGDAFVAKLNNNGVLQWNTFLGGSDWDYGLSIAVDTSGNVYVAGNSYATWGSPVRPYTGSADAFVAKLDGSGALQWNTFLGGSGDDSGSGIAVDTTGNVYVTGTSSATWGSPVLSYSGGKDAFAAKLNNSGALQWNTFLGGSDYDFGHSIAEDTSGNVYVAGYSYATWGSPILPYSGYYDAFAAKLDGTGILQWNTFLGSSSSDYGYGIAADTGGNVYVTGVSGAWGSPVRQYAGGTDAFVAKIEPSGPVLFITPDHREVSSAAGTTTFAVSNAGTGTIGWTAQVTSGASWLSIQSGPSGTNSGTITAAYMQNPGPSSRMGTIQVTAAGPVGSPRNVTVSQLGITTQPALSVTPAEGLSSSGMAGGPFSPSSKDYTLQNTGGGALSWAALGTQRVTLSRNSGTLYAGQSTTVTVSINADANILTGPSYSDTLTFTNATNGTGNTTRSVSLSMDYRQFITVRGADNWIYSRCMNTSEEMSVWTKLNGKTDVTPATAVFNGKLYMIVKSDIDTKIWYNSMTPNGVWGNWELMDGFTSDKPSVAVFNNKLYIAVRGTDNVIYFRSMTTAETFSWWAAVPKGLTSVAPAIHAFNNMLYLVVKDSGDDKIWWNVMGPSEMWWGWTLMDGLSPSTAALTSFTDNKLYICVRGTDNKIYYRSMSTYPAFAPWGSLAGLTDASPALEAYNSKLYLIVKSNVDMAIWWNSMTGAGVWGTFALMDGLSPTTASLAAAIY